MRRLPRPAVLALLTVVLLAAAMTGCKDKPQDFALPEDLAALLPDGASILVVVPSLDRWDEQWLALADTSDGQPGLPYEILEGLDLRAKLAEEAPGLLTVADASRPLAMAVKTPPMGSEPGVTIVFARLDPDAKSLPTGEEQLVQLSRGDYTAFSNDPGYAPVDSLPPLAQGLMGGLVSARIDLGAIVKMYRPMIEIGMGALAMTPPPDPESDQPQQGLSPAEAASLVEMMRAVMNSADLVDMALDIDGQDVQLGSRFTVQPGSPLEAGPQPDMATALALTSLLPAGADLRMAAAIDQSKQLEVFEDFYVASMGKNFGGDPQLEAAFVDWFTGYLDGYELLAVPMAIAETFGETGVHVHVAMTPDDPAWVLAWTGGQLEAINGLGLGLEFGARESVSLGGVDVHQWPAIIDLDAVDMPGPPGQTALQKQMWTAMFLSDTPMIRMAVVDRVMLITTDPDDEILTGMIGAAAAGPGKPDAELAALAKRAGPACREVVAGDLAAILVWIGRVSGMEMEPAERTLPLKMIVTQDGPEYGFGISMDVPGLIAGVHTLAEMAETMEQGGGKAGI